MDTSIISRRISKFQDEKNGQIPCQSLSQLTGWIFLFPGTGVSRYPEVKLSLARDQHSTNMCIYIYYDIYIYISKLYIYILSLYYTYCVIYHSVSQSCAWVGIPSILELLHNPKKQLEISI